MLERIDQLIADGSDFAFETTLATRSYVQLIRIAQQKGYTVTLLFFWLNSPDFAKKRVADRVLKGGHNIPIKIIERRFYRGIANLCHLYMPVCDDWAIFNNMGRVSTIIAVGGSDVAGMVANRDIYSIILSQSKLDDQR
jgi:predicted ABC-type ATPase